MNLAFGMNVCSISGKVWAQEVAPATRKRPGAVATPERPEATMQATSPASAVQACAR